jgi:phosphoenolpyruvate synthase/pyruvate phosphate dikinase
LRIVSDPEDAKNAASDEILVLKEAPISLPPVAGLIFSRPTTPLSHLNVLARSLAIPTAHLGEAARELKKYEGSVVAFEVTANSFSFHPASAGQMLAYQNAVKKLRRQMTPVFNLNEHRLMPLGSQTAAMAVSYGAKSANLGAVKRRNLPGVTVPDGVTLPFSWFAEHLRRGHLDAKVKALLSDPRIKREPLYRRSQLATIRNSIVAADMPPALRAAVLREVHSHYADAGLFVRSSTNAEDLKGFSGAGIYTTVPNARGDDNLIRAIKTVWASVWNEEAYNAREQAGIPHEKVFMAVLLQRSVKADSAGVLITANPFSPADRDAVYISAKRGLGLRVVDGLKVPEQILWRPSSASALVLTRSQDDCLLALDANGGVKPVPITPGRAVLTTPLVRQLVDAGLSIKRMFGGNEDIEWAFQDGRLNILQARPYQASSH